MLKFISLLLRHILFRVAVGIALFALSGAVLVTFFENKTNDEFQALGDAIWYVFVTMTTVGYGDIYPITVLGKILGGFIAILGIGMFAMPAGIIAAGFASELHNPTLQDTVCPHCGKKIEA